MTLLVIGLHPSIQTVVARFQESMSRRKLSYEYLFQNSLDEGDLHQTRIQWFTEAANAKGKKNDKLVYCIE